MDERTRAEIERAGAALVEHYPRLVRLAYLVLPPAMGRHRRVLTAHALVQRALPRAGGRAVVSRLLPAQRATPTGPGPRSVRRTRQQPLRGARTEPGRATGEPLRAAGTTGRPAARPTGADPGYALVRLRTLRLALAYERRQRRRDHWSDRLPALAARRPRLPFVWGLRFLPRAGGADELALDQALGAVRGPVRAAFALSRLEGLEETQARALLAEAGIADPGAELRAAARLDRSAGAGAEALLGTGDFDPCTVQTRPTDLLRRRQRVRAAAAVAVVLVVAALLMGVPGRGARPADDASVRERRESARALDPDRLERAPRRAWADTSRPGLAVWPARGGRTADRALLERALRTWAAPARRVRVTAAPGATTRPPQTPPRLLYAGDVDGRAVVLFHDGRRVVRYAEPATGPTGRAPGAALDFALLDDTDVTAGAALAVSRSEGRARYLAAPWIAGAELVDLRAPDAPARAVRVGGDGVTGAVPVPGPVAVSVPVVPTETGASPGEVGALSGEAGAFSGRAGAFSGEAGAFSGRAGALSGEPGALSGKASALSGEPGALSGEAGALSREPGALRTEFGASVGERAGGGCGQWPAIRFRTSEALTEGHAFLATDLGGLAPAHLTFTPPPRPGQPPRQPHEVTDTQARRVWARTACSLTELRGAGVRSVNNWTFAEQPLPEGGGRADWLCSRADTWRGPGRVTARFLPPAASPGDPGTIAGRARDTALCSRFGRHVVAAVRWRAASGRWYLLAAGSRAVTRIEATGDVRATAYGGPLAAPIAARDDGPKAGPRADSGAAPKAGPGAGTRVVGRLPNGKALPALGE
ncbi:hypothetical protein [Streptomyces sp. NPDC003077]|uniref:hypothetical protein n=1 Tax=Streptomyces sp. NPDC003077 TaxID=3154443 RepID=UPI0033AC8C02